MPFPDELIRMYKRFMCYIVWVLLNAWSDFLRLPVDWSKQPSADTKINNLSVCPENWKEKKKYINKIEQLKMSKNISKYKLYATVDAQDHWTHNYDFKQKKGMHVGLRVPSSLANSSILTESASPFVIGYCSIEIRTHLLDREKLNSMYMYEGWRHNVIFTSNKLTN